jgi:hypothetical protein
VKRRYSRLLIDFVLSAGHLQQLEVSHFSATRLSASR